MRIANLIKDLRKKPNSKKSFFLWSAVSVIMLIVVLVWLSFGLPNNDIIEQQTPAPAQDNKSSAIKGATGLWEEFKGDFLYLKDQLSGVMGDFLSGKHDPQEIPTELEPYLPDANLNIPPQTLPQTN